MYNLLWQKKQEREQQGDSITPNGFSPRSVDGKRTKDTEWQGSFIYFASKIIFFPFLL